MLFEIVIAIVLGIGAGIITGLIPGVHINMVSALVVTSSLFLSQYFSLTGLSVFIIAMAVTHTFLDTIPAILLGAPEAETALSVLPGHKMLLEGRGYEAIKLTVIGSLAGLVISIALFPVFFLLIPKLHELLRPFIGWLLLAIMAYLILIEKGMHAKFWSLVIFLLSGILGIAVLAMPAIEQPLLPMLSGLFGTSMLLVSLSNKTKIPEQHINDKIAVGKQGFKAISAGVFSGSFVSFFPGLGPAQAAVMSSTFVGEVGTAGFLILIGCISTVNMTVSLVTMHTIERARNGAVLAVMELLQSVDMSLLLLFTLVALIAGGIATILALFLSRIFIKVITLIDYSKVCIIVLAFITLLVFLISSWMGLLILIVSTAIGIIPNILDIKRSHAMGCLIIPVILFFIL